MADEWSGQLSHALASYLHFLQQAQLYCAAQVRFKACSSRVLPTALSLRPKVHHLLRGEGTPLLWP